MPAQRFQVTVAAGGVNPNIIAGSQFEFLGVPSRIQIYCIGDPQPASGPYNLEVFFGQSLELADGPGPNGAVAVGPVVPDDLVLDDVGGAGDRLVIRVSETGGVNPAIVRVLVVFTPLV